MTSADIFSSFNLAGVEMANRIVMAPMTRSRVGEGHRPAALTGLYYSQRASSGLEISEAIVVMPEGRGYLDTPGLYTAEQQDAWTTVTTEVHKSEGRIFAQLWHVGRVAHSSTLPPGAHPLSSTADHAAGLSTYGVNESGEPGKVAVSPPVAMNHTDVERVVSAFAAAAVRAVHAEFDGVEILAGNGYLFDQFLNAAVNRREDEYGGKTPESRCRLLLEVVDAIMENVDGQIPLGVRISPYGRFNGMPADDATGETYLYLAAQLSDRGVSYVHFNDEPVSIGHLNEGAAVAAPDQVVEAEDGAVKLQRLIPEDFFPRFKSLFQGPVVLCGGLDLELAREFLASGKVDLVAFGLPYVANPDLVARFRCGWPLNEPNTDLLYGGNERGYTDYPAFEEQGRA